MNATRSVMWMVGVLFILGGALLLFFDLGLDRWISMGVLIAGLLLFVGLAVMGFAGGAPNDPPRAATGVAVVARNPTFEGDNRYG